VTWKSRANDTIVGTVYVLRFEDGGFYVGWSKSPESRIKAHREGLGAAYTRKKHAAGVEFEVYAVFQGTKRTEEYVRKLHAPHGPAARS
jgi:predicted GIY-YIG superfamily endonuclease